MAVYCGNYMKNTDNPEKMADFFLILKHKVHIVTLGLDDHVSASECRNNLFF
jgi:hypothetical protein